MAELSVEIGGVKIRNPTMLAAGIMGTTGASLKRIAACGAGAVVTKSIGMHPNPGYPGPVMVKLEHGFLNAMGLPNPGCDDFAEELKIALEGGIPVVASIYGKNVEEFTTVATTLQEANALELNMSCPHAKKGYGADIASDPMLYEQIIQVVKDAVDIPVWVKLPFRRDIADLGVRAQKSGADAVVAINTLPAMSIDIETGWPVLGNRVGGLSGATIKPVALRCVYSLYDVLDIPIIGVGGVSRWEDAVEFIMAGAAAVQIGSAVYEDINIFKSISEGLSNYLDAHDMTLQDLLGSSHEV